MRLAARIKACANNPPIDREKEELSSVEALARLKEIDLDMSSLVESVTVFITWWSQMASCLGSIKQTISLPGFSRLHVDRASEIQEKWVEVGTRYTYYTREVNECVFHRVVHNLFPLHFR